MSVEYSRQFVAVVVECSGTVRVLNGMPFSYGELCAFDSAVVNNYVHFCVTFTAI